MPKPRIRRVSKMDFEKELSNQMIQDNKDSNFGICVCEVTGMTIPNSSKHNAAHVVSKGSNDAARLDRENILIVRKEVHDIMDNAGIADDPSDENIIRFFPAIKYNPILLEKVRVFVLGLQDRRNEIKAKYSEVEK